MSAAKAVIVTQAGNHEDKDRKKTYIMAQHFIIKYVLFRGKLGKDVLSHFQNYELTLNDYKCSPEEKLAYLESLIEREDKQHCDSTPFHNERSY